MARLASQLLAQTEFWPSNPGSERGRRDNSFWLPRVPSVDKEKKKSTTSQMRCAGGVAQCVMKGPPLVERRARPDRRKRGALLPHCRHCLGMPTWPRTGETKGRREYACAPERPCAVFLHARTRHWNCDRGCEPTQLVERPNRDSGVTMASHRRKLVMVRVRRQRVELAV
jgi:hypothetical protein